MSGMTMSVTSSSIVIVMFARHPDRFVGGGGAENVVTGFAQDGADQIAHDFFIFDHEDRFRAAACPSIGRGISATSSSSDADRQINRERATLAGRLSRP